MKYFYNSLFYYILLLTLTLNAHINIINILYSPNYISPNSTYVIKIINDPFSDTDNIIYTVNTNMTYKVSQRNIKRLGSLINCGVNSFITSNNIYIYLKSIIHHAISIFVESIIKNLLIFLLLSVLVLLYPTKASRL